MTTRIKARNYKFKDCSYKDENDREITIPDGIWPVAELDMVAIYVGTKTYDLSSSSFQSLKLSKSAMVVE